MKTIYVSILPTNKKKNGLDPLAEVAPKAAGAFKTISKPAIVQAKLLVGLGSPLEFIFQTLEGALIPKTKAGTAALILPFFYKDQVHSENSEEKGLLPSKRTIITKTFPVS